MVTSWTARQWSLVLPVVGHAAWPVWEAVDVGGHVAVGSDPLALDAGPGANVRTLDRLQVELFVDVGRQLELPAHAAHRALVGGEPYAQHPRSTPAFAAQLAASMSVGADDRFLQHLEAKSYPECTCTTTRGTATTANSGAVAAVDVGLRSGHTGTIPEGHSFQTQGPKGIWKHLHRKGTV